MSLYLLYPEKRPIDEDAVIQWAHDLQIDDAIADHWATFDQPGDYDDRLIIENNIRNQTPAPTLDDAIALLSDRGVCTFARGLR